MKKGKLKTLKLNKRLFLVSSYANWVELE